MIGTATYCLYRGRQFTETWRGRDRVSGGEIVQIRRPDDVSSLEFPDAVAMGGEVGSFWVRLPRRKLSREWRETVYGTWKGVEFCLRRVTGRSTDALWGYTSDPQAGTLGIAGNQYDGWAGELPADEVRLCYRMVFDYPLAIPYGDARLRGIPEVRTEFDATAERES